MFGNSSLYRITVHYKRTELYEPRHQNSRIRVTITIEVGVCHLLNR